MSTNRLFKGIAALATVVLFALPAGSAFAMPHVDAGAGAARSASSVPTSMAKPPEFRDREAYYLAKERQAEQAATIGRRVAGRHQKPSRVSVASARLNRYAAFKEQQIERIMNGE